jgi:hypothetical protein
MSTASTCGPLYLDGLTSFTGMDADKIPIFAAGFVSGQAEKIYLGACRAAMFRPSEEWHSTVMGIVRQVAERYMLRVHELQTSRGVEIWLCKSRNDYTALVVLDHMEENSPEWHRRRGEMCGIPESDIDLEFHKRSGFGEPCDK